MNRFLKLTYSVVVFLLIILSSRAINNYICTKEYQNGDKIDANFSIIAVNDKNLPLTDTNVTLLFPYERGPEEFDLYKRSHPEHTFDLPKGTYSLTIGNDHYTRRIVKISSKNVENGKLVGLDVREDDYNGFQKYIVQEGKIMPLEFRFTGLHTRMNVLIIAFLIWLVYAVLNRLFKVKEKVLTRLATMQSIKTAATKDEKHKVEQVEKYTSKRPFYTLIQLVGFILFFLRFPLGAIAGLILIFAGGVLIRKEIIKIKEEKQGLNEVKEIG